MSSIFFLFPILLHVIISLGFFYDAANFIILTGEFDYFARSVAQRNYQLKDEDFPLLVLSTHGGNNGGRNYNEKPYHYQAILFSPPLLKMMI